MTTRRLLAQLAGLTLSALLWPESRALAEPGLSDGGSGGLALLALAALFLLRRRGARAARWLAPFLISSLAIRQASAQVALDHFKPAPLVSDGFALGRPEVLGRLDYSAMLLLDYANDPLVYEIERGSSKNEERVVNDHLVGHAAFGLGLLDRLTVFASLPVHLMMKGEKKLTVPAPKADGAGLGDFALGARVQLLDDKDTRYALAFDFTARLPTARSVDSDQAYSGDRIGSYEPALVGEVRLGRFDARLRLGARLRKETRIFNLDLGQEILAGVGARYRLGDGLFVNAELYGSSFTTAFFDRPQTPFELLLGVKHWGEAWSFGAAAGPGLTRGYGAPNLRVVGMVGYSPRPQKDRDGDGLVDDEDACPDDPEDLDQHKDFDGCPDPDDDEDGIPDVKDSCPNDPEDRDDFEDEDGCSDPDNDGDGILDMADACPNEPEDMDGFEDQDGCPDPDNDEDGVLDVEDECPTEPEDFDAFEDDDGCPEEGSGKVKLTCEKIEIGESVFFDVGKDTIQQRSFALLDQVVSVLRSATHVTKLRVEGHTDDSGRDAYNLELSKRRAASVMRYLVQHGIDQARLTSEGYGQERPIADNTTPAGRAKNRRVEIQVLEQKAGCEKP